MIESNQVFYNEIDVDGVIYIEFYNPRTGKRKRWVKSDDEWDEEYDPSTIYLRFYSVYKDVQRRRRRKSLQERTITVLKIHSMAFRKRVIHIQYDYTQHLTVKGITTIYLPNRAKIFQQLKQRFPDLEDRVLKRMTRRRLMLHIRRELFKLYRIKDPRGETPETIQDIQFNIEGILK